MNEPLPAPTSIRILLADGTPDGIRIVEKPNWTGRALSAARSHLKRALKREEFDRPGIYLLTGWSQEGERQAYIGESEDLRVRIKLHTGDKGFWTRVVAFLSTNDSLNKAYLRYLEARLIRLAIVGHREPNQPLSPPLSEMDTADAEWFLAEMRVIFPLLGVDAFEEVSGAPGRELPKLRLVTKRADADGREVDDGFVVMQGSRASVTETPAIPDRLKKEREKLLQNGVLVPEGEELRFTQD
ncbi:MAG: GIY-YIG nuclease family protein [Gemmatimonadetes bacterium]|nr:GIY-YIG nuclease family protein [Gemmatimonadota bacterium]MYG22488.1 GIY-YIG nuclease family protein [Gemmatimonadota bacterium]MYJ39659.1 GIY-YIG nuclease family protein [Gemmatimonadota bacterium]